MQVGDEGMSNRATSHGTGGEQCLVIEAERAGAGARGDDHADLSVCRTAPSSSPTLPMTHHKLPELGQQKLTLAGWEAANGLKLVTEVGSDQI